MFINKKGKNQGDEFNACTDKSSNFSGPKNSNLNNQSSTKINKNRKFHIEEDKNLRKISQDLAPKSIDLYKSTLESGPEIMLIESVQSDRRNAMMNYTDGRQIKNKFNHTRSPTDISNTGSSIHKNSVLTNIRKDVGSYNEGGWVASSSIPLIFDLEREKSPKVINLDDQSSLYSMNTRMLNQKKKNEGYNYSLSSLPNKNMNNLSHFNNFSNFNNNFFYNQNSYQSSNLNTTKSEANQTFISELTKVRNQTEKQTKENLNNLNNINNNAIPSKKIKKKAPNRSKNVDVSGLQVNEKNKIQQLKNLSKISEKNNPIFQQKKSQNQDLIKPEYKVDTKEKFNVKYTGDLEKIIKFNIKQESFKKYNSSAIVANLPREGKLYTTKTHIISPMEHHKLEEQKTDIKHINKLSKILIKDTKEQKEKYKGKDISQNLNSRTATICSTSSHLHEISFKTNKIFDKKKYSPSRKFIRVTMALLSGKNPDCEDRIITRNMRCEKGGVVDLAQPLVKSNRSAPKRILEMKKYILRSPRRFRNLPQFSIKKKENAAKMVQSWWREVLSKYKDIVKRTVTIQKSWRRYTVRKNLYFQLSTFYFYAYLFDKMENLIKRHNLILGFEQLYNQNAEKYNAIKYLKNVIFIQRAFRFYKNLNKQKEEILNNLFNTKEEQIPTKPFIDIVNRMQTSEVHQTQASDFYNSTAENEIDEPRILKASTFAKRDLNKNAVKVTIPLIAEKQEEILYIKAKSQLSSSKKWTNGAETLASQAEKEYIEKEKQLEIKLRELKIKFFSNAALNLINNKNKTYLTFYVLKWMKNSLQANTKTDAGKKLAASDITRAIIKKKYDLLISSLRKSSERPTNTIVLNRMLNVIFELFSNRKRMIFENFKKSLPNIKIRIKDQFIYKFLGINLKKTAAKIHKGQISSKFKLWKENALSIKAKESQQAEELINAIKKPINRICKKYFLKFIKGLNYSCELEILKKFLIQKDLRFKNLNLPYFFHVWINKIKEADLINLRNLILGKMIKSFDKSRNIKSLSKRFVNWSELIKENRTVTEQVLVSKKKNTKLTAAFKLVPMLRVYLRNEAAKISGKAIIYLIHQKNRRIALKKLLRFKPFFEKYQMKKYFDKLKNFVAFMQKSSLKGLLMKALFRKLLAKSTDDLLRKKMNFWWRCLPHTNTGSLKNIKAVGKLKQALQKKYLPQTEEAMKEKIQSKNFDWALMFLIEFRKRFLKNSIREYTIRWRNSYLREMVNEKMKVFYAKSIYNLNKRLLIRNLEEYFQKWKFESQCHDKEILVSSSKNFKNRVHNIYLSRVKLYFDILIKNMGFKNEISKRKNAANIVYKLAKISELRTLEKRFRSWNKLVTLTEISELKQKLILKILSDFLNNRQQDESIGEVRKFFSKWRYVSNEEVEKLNNINQMVYRYLNRQEFHHKLVTKNITHIVKFAKSFYELRRKQCSNIGEFISKTLTIFRRIKIMKRQKTLFEALKKMTFHEKMQILLVCKKWQIKTAVELSIYKATILQDFIRKIYKYKMDKAVLHTNVITKLNNYTKRLVLYKMNEAVNTKNFISILNNLFSSILENFKSKTLRGYCIYWKNTAQELERTSAINVIIKGFRSLIARKFLFKLKLRKELIREIIRRKLISSNNAKLLNIIEWARNANLLKLKSDALVLSSWISYKFKAFKKFKANEKLFNLFYKDNFNKIISILINFAKMSSLFNKIKKINFYKNAFLFWKGVKQISFNRRFSPAFIEIIHNFQTENLKFYIGKWREKILEWQTRALIKIQAFTRMNIIKFLIGRELEKSKLLYKIFLKIHWDAKITKQGYINLWRNNFKYKKIDDLIRIFQKVVKAKNDKMDYENGIANKKLKILFEKSIIISIKNIMNDSRAYKAYAIHVLKNFDSKIEKRYSVNNLIDSGKNLLQRVLINIVKENNNKHLKNEFFRKAIEKWKAYNDRFNNCIIKVQKMRRGKVFRDHFNKSKKLYDLLARLSNKHLGEEQQKRIRIWQWASKIHHFLNNEKANVIQKFLRKNLNVLSQIRMKEILIKGYRKHLVNYFVKYSKLKKLKDSIRKPLNSLTIKNIWKTSLFYKIQEILRKLIINSTKIFNRDQTKNLINLWRNRINEKKELEKSTCLLISAAIKAKCMRLKIKRLQTLNSKLNIILVKYLGNSENIKKYAVLRWIKIIKGIAMLENKEEIAKHAKCVLRIIENEKSEKSMFSLKQGFDRIQEVIHNSIGKQIFARIRDNMRNMMFNKIYENNKRNNKEILTAVLKNIKIYGIYKINLIKNLQKFLKNRYKLSRFIKKTLAIRKAIEYEYQKELSNKRAYSSLWRLNAKKINNSIQANKIQKFYSQILDFQRLKKSQTELQIKNLIKRTYLRKYFIKMFKNLKTMILLKNIENLMVKKFFKYFKIKASFFNALNIINLYLNKGELNTLKFFTEKYKKSVLEIRNKSAAQSILRCLKELKNRKYENTIRDLIATIILCKEQDERNILMKASAYWCRLSHEIKVKEMITVIDNFLSKRKQAYNIKSKWHKLCDRLKAINCVLEADYLIQKTNLYRKIERFSKFIICKNIAKNGKSLIDFLKKKILTEYLSKALRTTCKIIDSQRVQIYVLIWQKSIRKMDEREKALDNAMKILHLKFLEKAFKILVATFDFIKYKILTRIVFLNYAFRMIKKEAELKLSLEKFSNGLVSLKELYNICGIKTFKERLLKLYHYKLFANMGAIFLKFRNSNYMHTFYIQFWKNFKSDCKIKSTYKYAITDTINNTPKTLSNKLNLQTQTLRTKKQNQLFDLHSKSQYAQIFRLFYTIFNRLIKKRKKDFMSLLCTLNALKKIIDPIKKRQKWALDNLKSVLKNSIIRANSFVIFRMAYLKKKLKEIESANPYLILNHLIKLTTITREKVNLRFLLKYLRNWKFKCFSNKLKDEKIESVKNSLDQFANKLHYDLFEGPDSINNMYQNLNSSLGVFQYPKLDAMKKITSKAAKQYEMNKSNRGKFPSKKSDYLLDKNKSEGIQKEDFGIKEKDEKIEKEQILILEKKEKAENFEIGQNVLLENQQKSEKIDINQNVVLENKENIIHNEQKM